MTQSTFFADTTNFRWNFWGCRDKEWFEVLAERWDNRIHSKTDLKLRNKCVPKIIHQIWIGSHQIPLSCINYMKSWKEFNPDFKYQLWTDKEIAAFSKEARDTLSLQLNPAQKADIIRLLILQKCGGIYVDVDFECVKPIASLLGENSFFVGFSNTRCVEINNALIACTSEHPLINYLAAIVGRPWQEWGETEDDAQLRVLSGVEEMLGDKEVHRIFHESKNHFIGTTGPGFLTRAVISWIKQHEQREDLQNLKLHHATIYPPRFFYPVPNAYRLTDKSIKLSFIDSEDTYAIHHWMKTWDF